MNINSMAQQNQPKARVMAYYLPQFIRYRRMMRKRQHRERLALRLVFPLQLKGVNRPFYVLHTLYHRKSNPRRQPLIWNVARQVGKTWGVGIIQQKC